jgi:2-acylglycerol O-acyltransferase 2
MIKIGDQSFFKHSLFFSYAAVGLAACSQFGLLRGRGLQSVPSLALLKLYFFSLFWLPLSQISIPGSIMMLFYLPFYCDLSEYNGWRISDTFRRSFVGGLFKRVFNTKIVATSEIKEQCIVGLHPHGIIPLGTIVNVASEASDFSKLYPALSQSRVVIAASSCFLVPGFRDLLVTSGVLDCSRFNAEKWLRKGFSVFVVPGGAREGLYSNPDIDWLDLRRKLGFIRLAITHNVAVVPAYTFNEVDYCTQLPYHDIARWPTVVFLRRNFQQIFGISLPLVYSISLPLPKVDGITTVVGEPIHFPHLENPTDEEVNECLSVYVKKLQKLYDVHAPLYNSRPRPLVIS